MLVYKQLCAILQLRASVAPVRFNACAVHQDLLTVHQFSTYVMVIVIVKTDPTKNLLCA